MNFFFSLHGVPPIRQPIRTTRRHVQPAPVEQLDLPVELVDAAELWRRALAPPKQH